MLIPWLLVPVCAYIMWRWCRDWSSGRAVPLVLLWDGAALVGFFAWARAARDVWPQWGFDGTIIIWFVVGVLSIVWTVLALGLVGKDEPPPDKGAPMGGDNYVAAHRTTRQRYQWRGRRARKTRRK